jgi:F420-non-reducing hydrogenase iron-sulfur subunit
LNNQTDLKLYFFCCANSIDSEELCGFYKGQNRDTLKFINLPCSGKVTVPYLMKVFEKGADGVMIITCKEGECQRLEGNLRASKRAEMVDSLLEEIGLGTGRMKIVRWTEEGIDGVKREIDEFRATIGHLPVTNSAIESSKAPAPNISESSSTSSES